MPVERGMKQPGQQEGGKWASWRGGKGFPSATGVMAKRRPGKQLEKASTKRFGKSREKKVTLKISEGKKV